MSCPEPLTIQLAPKARQDLIDILRYTGETWGPNQLLVYRGKLDGALQAISSNPQAGHRREDLPSTHRADLVGSHVTSTALARTALALCASSISA